MVNGHTDIPLLVYFMPTISVQSLHHAQVFYKLFWGSKNPFQTDEDENDLKRFLYRGMKLKGVVTTVCIYIYIYIDINKLEILAF